MRTLLQPVPHQVGQVLAAGLYRPSEAGTMVGGDLFDIRSTPSGERAVIGDVRGKGLQAVHAVAAVLGSFREAAHEGVGLEVVAARLERRLAREAKEIPDEELCSTALLVEYDSGAQRVRLSNHGHVEPVLISGGEVRVPDDPPGLPLGLGSLAESDGRAVWSHPLAPGDVLLLERLAHRLGGRAAPGPAEVVDFLDTDLPRHARSLHDDVAILAISPNAAG
ncbi:PP2C family protein-serine/threonine phosphatase [Streptomyces manipurensis]|uniref:PP2C family protein-serine/threonine phosphatase n=1 Tax=Streptomyces manipurensis TaxID=1077945 RepID=UPI003C6F851A